MSALAASNSSSVVMMRWSHNALREKASGAHSRFRGDRSRLLPDCLTSVTVEEVQPRTVETEGDPLAGFHDGARIEPSHGCCPERLAELAGLGVSLGLHSAVATEPARCAPLDRLGNLGRVGADPLSVDVEVHKQLGSQSLDQLDVPAELADPGRGPSIAARG